MIPAMIVPILSGPDVLAGMLATVDHPIEHLIVIDNGGNDLRIDCPHANRVSVIDMPANLGVAGSWNLGVKSAPFAPWWMIASFDIRWPVGSLARFAAEARPDRLLLSAGSPPWCAVALGSQVVQEVGLFDERFYPAYCEDLDYAARAGRRVAASTIPVEHRNSTTLELGWRAANDRTAPANSRWLEGKMQRGDVTAGWDLARRRALDWGRRP